MSGNLAQLQQNSSETMWKKGNKVIITKRGKPVGLIIPFTDKVAVAEALLEEAESLLKESGTMESDVLKALEKARKRGLCLRL